MAYEEASSLSVPNVLRDRLITIEPGGIDRPISLVELLARLLAGENDVLSFPRLAPVQRSYWYRFIVRCAAKALHSLGLGTREAGELEVNDLAARIERSLAEAAGGEEAWLLYQSDPTRPAFLQPPTPDGAAPDDTYTRNSMSILSSAIGSKNHERKYDVDRELDPELAIYALIEYQTGVIFGGRGNYGSQLMGSAAGAGSGTPFMGVRIGSGYRDTFRHDVSVFLSRWGEIRSHLRIEGNIWALWTVPWDGKSQLPASHLDPAFIPFARLVRLGEPMPDGRFDTVWFRASDCARVADHSDGGLFGDIFTPLVPHPKHPGGRKVRGTLRNGYNYEEVVRLLFGFDAMPSASVLALSDPRYPIPSRVRVVFEGTAFEQGKTCGFFYREVLFPSQNAIAFLANPEPVAAVHKVMLRMAKEAKSAIRGATRILLAGSPKPRDGDGNKVEKPAQQLEHAIDQVYIPTLLKAAEQYAKGDMKYVEDWGRTLTEITRSTFRDIMRGIPTSGARRYEREIYATTWLDFRLRVMRGEERTNEVGVA